MPHANLVNVLWLVLVLVGGVLGSLYGINWFWLIFGVANGANLLYWLYHLASRRHRRFVS